MITGINELKALTKHISCKCKCKFDGRKYNLNQKWNNYKCWCECKKHHMCEKDYIWNHATCSCKNGKYLASIIDDSVITCDKTRKVNRTTKKQKLFQQILMKKNITCRKKIFFYSPFY